MLIALLLQMQRCRVGFHIGITAIALPIFVSLYLFPLILSLTISEIGSLYISSIYIPCYSPSISMLIVYHTTYNAIMKESALPSRLRLEQNNTISLLFNNLFFLPTKQTITTTTLTPSSLSRVLYQSVYFTLFTYYTD